MYKKLLACLICLIFLANAFAQQKASVKYPSLLWEISGNGLSRPSYLFGTMHVSNKLAFHLSDSFYHALRNVDAVALELNPELWQGQMARLDQLKENYASFVQKAGNDFLNESSFRLEPYEEQLITALSTEPSVVNNLLYRSYKTKEDFEEDTFLDLYIYQTGRKLGKRPAGVEDYYEAEKLVLEAYGDMAREKKKKNIDLDGDNMRDIFEKVQNAYRRGDLDMMDSLDNMMERSDAFREKFLFKRNEIQANSIDSIIRHTSLFAGVGAAHLPGSRGVIELLRKKGYIIRPVKMTDRDGLQRSEIDNLRVPVHFEKRTSEDGFYSVEVPGELFKINQDFQSPDRRQFADMSNGSYYIVSRVPTHSDFLHQSAEKVLKKVDSLLYENIPGKILTKKQILKNGYNGFDISARTRRGDLQRYQIFVTPFEILIFKMSGREDYVSGKEALQFFSTIQLNQIKNTPALFEPETGGFKVNFPQLPHIYYNTYSSDERWEYEATDTANGNAYLVLKKSINNFDYIDEDTFNLSLMEESFRNDDFFDKLISRNLITVNGKPVLIVKEKWKGGIFVNTRFYINGAHRYIVAQSSKDSSGIAAAFFNSFELTSFKYKMPSAYIDTFLKAKVSTSVAPRIDEGLRKIIEQNAEDAANGNNYSGYISYWPKASNGIFKSEATGELVAVQVQELPQYFYIRDSLKYWQKEIDDLRNKEDMDIALRTDIHEPGISGIRVSLSDSGSSTRINYFIFLKNNYKYTLTAVGDSINDQQGFAQDFLYSFRPLAHNNERDIYESRLPVFFNDLFSKDSARQARAQQSIPNLYYGPEGAPYISSAIQKLAADDKDYYEIKNKLITELGYINDSTGKIVVPLLKDIYERAADTILFQNEVIKSLARLQTKESYKLLKTLILQDPPVFDYTYDLNSVFGYLGDTLELSKGLFPGLLQLSSLDDYKDKVLRLLVKGVDSNYISRKDYQKYFPSILIDAKVAFKKQKIRDEKRKQAESKNQEGEPVRVYRNPNNGDILLNDYAVLLMPFYDKNKDVQQFFNGLLHFNDGNTRLNAIVLMLRNKRTVADSLIFNLADDDKYRGQLYDMLVKSQLQQYFPAAYHSQLALAKSYLIMENDYDKMDSLVYLKRQATVLKGKKGYVYFFKYRIYKENDWKIGMIGLQPLNDNELSADPLIAMLTDTKLKQEEPVEEQLNAQLKKILFTYHKSGKNFYNNRDEFIRY